MRLMEEKIRAEGKVLPGGVLKVGSFLNQRIDTGFLREMGKEIARLYAGAGVNKVLTIEASGIAIAAAAAMELEVPMVFAKKHRSSNVEGGVYSSTVHSFTHGWWAGNTWARRTGCCWWTTSWPTARRCGA